MRRLHVQTPVRGAAQLIEERDSELERYDKTYQQLKKTMADRCAAAASASGVPAL